MSSATEQSSGTYQRILVGTDGSSTATVAVDRALALARDHRASVTILSAGGSAERVLSAESERLEGSDVPFTVLAATGEPAHALVDEAKKGDYDVLVVGNKGIHGIRRLNPLGSVPGRLSHRLPCALLVVKTT